MADPNALIDKKYKYKEADPQYKGEPMNPSLAFGPLANRKCNDVFFILIYFISWGAMIYLSIIAFKQGDPRRLATPFDPDGNQCGYGIAENYPYLYFNQLSNTSTSLSTYACVSQCPKGKEVFYLKNKKVNLIDTWQDTHTIVYQCWPDSLNLENLVSDLMNKDIGSAEMWLQDVSSTWPIILASAFIALFLSFIIYYLLNWFAGFLVWFIIFLFFLVTIGIGSLCILQSRWKIISDLPDFFNDQQTLEILGIVVLSFAGICLLIFLCMISKIKKAIQIIECSALFCTQVRSIIISPIIMFILTNLFFAYWLIVSLYIFSSGEIIPDPTQPYGSIKWNKGVKRSLTYFLFCLFWNSGLFIAINQFVTATAASSWYYSHRPNGQIGTPVSDGFSRAFSKNFGSLAFGSMVLAIITLIKFFMKLMYNSLKAQTTGNDPVSCLAKFFVSCALCCVTCFEKMIRFISSYAYILIALEGKNFCSAAKDAFYLSFRNLALFGIVKSLANIFVFFASLMVSSLTAFIGYLIITNADQFSKSIYSPVVPTISFWFVAFIISLTFMSVYGIAADTLCVCLSVDREINNGEHKSCPKMISDFEQKVKE